MDPELQALSLELGQIAVRRTAGHIADRVRSAKASKKQDEIIADLEELVNELVADKAELVRIAQSFEEQLVAQRLSPADVQYVTSTILPVIKKLVDASSSSGLAPQGMQEVMDLIEPIMSVETLTMLQLIGFNFRRGIGEPLTNLVAQSVASKAKVGPTDAAELQRLALERQIAYLNIVADPAAFARFEQGNAS